MTVAGVMSGTSADGIDVSVVRIAAPTLLQRTRKDGAPSTPRLTLLAHGHFAYPAVLRTTVLAAMNAPSTSTAELARLNWRLGLAYAEAVKATAGKHKLRLDLVGCHGQTLYHQACAEKYAGRKFACTWQAGEAQTIAAALRLPVVSNFRPADMLAGGQGAPLVPLLDFVLFADEKRGRILQNIGGIANLTAIPPGAPPHAVLAFDTGPGNMVIDWLAQKVFNKPFDRNGAFAAHGSVLELVLKEALWHPYFKLRPPKTAGREQFGQAYAAEFLDKCLAQSKNPNDALATATALTADTIARSYARDARGHMKNRNVDFIVSGGGARNRTLMTMLAARLEPLGCTLSDSDAFGMPAEAKEGAAFALLAWQTWHRLPGNVPSATGAKRPAILGQITYA
jgi:anhydro-N-acetylmuramic acid kinase